MGGKRRGCPPGWRRALLAVVAIVMVSGCSPTSPPEPSPEPTASSVTLTPSKSPTPTPSPEPSPSPSPSSTLSEEQAAAADTVLEFFRLLTELSKNPELDVQPLTNITTGQTQTIEVNLIAQDREDGLIQTGDDLYYVTEVGPMSRREDNQVVDIEACSDSSRSDLVDEETGASVLGADRAYFVEWHIEVLYDGNRWKVGDITSESVEKCGP